MMRGAWCVMRVQCKSVTYKVAILYTIRNSFYDWPRYPFSSYLG
jgi:hypothetical protein